MECCKWGIVERPDDNSSKTSHTLVCHVLDTFVTAMKEKVNRFTSFVCLNVLLADLCHMGSLINEACAGHWRIGRLSTDCSDNIIWSPTQLCLTSERYRTSMHIQSLMSQKKYESHLTIIQSLSSHMHRRSVTSTTTPGLATNHMDNPG